MAASQSKEQGRFDFVTFEDAAACVVTQDPHVLDTKMESTDTDIESTSNRPKGGADGGRSGGGRKGRGGRRGRRGRGSGGGGGEKNEHNRMRKNSTERKRVLKKREALEVLNSLVGSLGHRDHHRRWTEAEILRSTQTLIKKLKEEIAVAVTTTRMTSQLRCMDLSLAENLGANRQ